MKSHFKPGHVRTPFYIKGKTGWVRCYGEFRNPESLGHGGDGLPRVRLYLVGFIRRTCGTAMTPPVRTRFSSTSSSIGSSPLHKRVHEFQGEEEWHTSTVPEKGTRPQA